MLLPLLTMLNSRVAPTNTPANTPTDPAPSGEPTTPENLSLSQQVERIMALRQGQAGDEGEMDPAQVESLRNEMRFFVMETRETWRELLPDATKGQEAEFIEALVNADPAALIKAVESAVKTSLEKSERGEEGDDKNLPVEGPGSGKPAKAKTAPKNSRDAVNKVLASFK